MGALLLNKCPMRPIRSCSELAVQQKGERYANRLDNETWQPPITFQLSGKMGTSWKSGFIEQFQSSFSIKSPFT